MKPTNSSSSLTFSAQAIDAAIKIILVLVMLMWTFNIIRPFMLPMAWGAIIAVALFPIVGWVKGKTGLGQGKASVLVTLITLAILIVPTVTFSSALFSSSQEFIGNIQEGTLEIPPPKPQVAEWPLVGEKLHAGWTKASTNLEAFAKQYAPQIKSSILGVASTVGGIGGGILQFVISIIIAGVFMANSAACTAAFNRIATRLAGAHGAEFASLSTATVRGVVQGVIGVAVIQAALSGLGMAIVGVPATGIWVLAVLILAIVQLPPILILAPIMAYVFSVEDSTTAVIFMIWGLLVSGSDAFLKPILMGRGVDIPMLVILLGAIGGMMMSGIIGLFVGAVIFALTYKLFMAWLELGDEFTPESDQEEHKDA